MPRVPTTHPRIQPRHSARSRPGSALVPFAIFVVAILGLAALAIDLVQPNLTLRQFHAAADAAALEGVRWRDTVPDLERRLLASQAVARLFDADGDLTTEDDLFGAGPQLSIIGKTSLDAVGQLSIGDATTGSARPLYRRRELVDGTRPGWLELNLPNRRIGDMVAGTYRNDVPHTDGITIADRWRPYLRPDFRPIATERDFLARLRRTSDPFNRDRIEDVSSAGPPLPWLFARGSTLRSTTGQGLAEGIDVRATSIARRDTARTVGPQILGTSIALPDTTTVPSLIGFAPFAIDYDALATLPIGSEFRIRVVPTGTITRPGIGPIGYTIRSTQLVASMSGTDTVMQSMNLEPNAIGPFPVRVRVGSEAMLIVANNGSGNYIVERAIEGTTAIPHPIQRRITIAEPISIGMAGEALRSVFEVPQPDLILINPEIDHTPPGLSVPNLRAHFLVPLLDEVPALPGTQLIVGFASVDVRRDQNRPNQFRLTKLDPAMPPLNASASVTADWISTIEQITGPLTEAQRRAIASEANQRPTDPAFIAPAAAPALVRSY